MQIVFPLRSKVAIACRIYDYSAIFDEKSRRHIKLSLCVGNYFINAISAVYIVRVLSHGIL